MSQLLKDAAAANTRRDTAATKLLATLLQQIGVAMQCPTLSDGLGELVISPPRAYHPTVPQP